MKNVNHYYSLWIGNEFEGRWNVIQVIGEQARYFVLNGELEKAGAGSMLITVGYIEDGWYTDGEDYEPLEKWQRHEGILIPFKY
ncbi:hypothetical protein [Peribacillus asahii]|uniref:hypothetical protein n=1 Tax=Peribacillus asahii TaxID=228899 RepID=UPI00207A7934|nr:hypothetical protein [Peribacillus asahii]USK62286.1 hypothetical protein LIT37_24240 [Peribacillus asahii]